jgi:hypothetical protein
MWGISGLAEDLLASQEDLFSILLYSLRAEAICHVQATLLQRHILFE